MFIGEKYIGANENRSDVLSIFISPQQTITGLIKDDFAYLTEKIREKYPNAEIHWKSPVQEFLQT